jgi:hypothetical protein
LNLEPWNFEPELPSVVSYEEGAYAKKSGYNRVRSCDTNRNRERGVLAFFDEWQVRSEKD